MELNTRNVTKNTPTETICKLVTSHMAAGKFTQKDVAALVGISPATLSCFLQNKYDGNVNTIKEKLCDFLNLASESELFGDSEMKFYKTEQTEAIFSVLAFARKRKSICVFYGQSGVGKTTAINEYARLYQNVFITTACYRVSSYVFFTNIMKEISIDKVDSTSECVEKIIERVKGTNYLLIVDEAQHLSIDHYEKLRYIHDMAKIGIVFSGTFKVVENMYSKEKILFDQLFSRATLKTHVTDEITKKDLENIFQHSGIPYDSKIINFVYKYSNGRGHLRMVKNLLDMANEIAVNKQSIMKYEHIEAASLLVFKDK